MMRKIKERNGKIEQQLANYLPPAPTDHSLQLQQGMALALPTQAGLSLVQPLGHHQGFRHLRGHHHLHGHQTGLSLIQPPDHHQGFHHLRGHHHLHGHHHLRQTSNIPGTRQVSTCYD